MLEMIHTRFGVEMWKNESIFDTLRQFVPNYDTVLPTVEERRNLLSEVARRRYMDKYA